MEPELTPEGIRSHYRHLTASHFERALQIPGLASQLLAIFSRLSDNQIMQAVPYMSTEQISKAIPRLELQQTGVAMRVMSPTQVRITMSSLLDEDRSLLSENITLLSSSTTKEELQSLLGFIDPLVIACAAQSDGGIADRLIETANSLTSEQIRIMMPMLNCSQIRRVFLIIEDDARFDVAFEMLDKKGEVIELLSKELPQVQEKLNVLRFEVVTTEKILNRLQSELNSKQSSDRQHTREIREVQTGIETLQRSVREIQTQHRLMGRLASQKEFESECLSKLEQDLTDLSSSVRSLHLLLCHETDGLIHRFNTTKSRLIVNDSPSSSPSRSHSNSPVASPPSSPVSKVRPRDRHNGQSQESPQRKSARHRSRRQPRTTKTSTNGNLAVAGSSSRSSSSAESGWDSVFTDDELAVQLFEAVKALGNPAAIGAHYTMSWEQIVAAGFRCTLDFEARGIASLSELQQFILDSRPTLTKA